VDFKKKLEKLKSHYRDINYIVELLRRGDGVKLPLSIVADKGVIEAYKALIAKKIVDMMIYDQN